MKSVIVLFVVLIMLALSACHGPVQVNDDPTPNGRNVLRKIELPIFLSKFKMLPDSDLSLSPTGTPENTIALDQSTSDTLFLKYAGGTRYGMLHDTSRYYGLLYYVAADAGALSLLVLDKKGMPICDTILGTGLYGSDCGYSWSGSAYIHRDHSIVLKDTVLSFPCDSAPPPADFSTYKHEATMVSAKINPDGKLVFTGRETHQFKP